MKKLPEFIIKGSLQKLIEIEPLLVMAGYDEQCEGWNNRFVKGDDGDTETIWCGEKHVEYHNHDCGERVQFKAHEIHKILYYIETGKVKEFEEDRVISSWSCAEADRPRTVDDIVVDLAKSKSKKKTKELLNKIGAVPYAFDNSRGLTKTNPEKVKQVEVAFNNWINDPIDGSKHEYTQGQKKEILTFIKSQL